MTKNMLPELDCQEPDHYEMIRNWYLEPMPTEIPSLILQREKWRLVVTREQIILRGEFFPPFPSSQKRWVEIFLTRADWSRFELGKHPVRLERSRGWALQLIMVMRKWLKKHDLTIEQAKRAVAAAILKIKELNHSKGQPLSPNSCSPRNYAERHQEILRRNLRMIKWLKAEAKVIENAAAAGAANLCFIK